MKFTRALLFFALAFQLIGCDQNLNDDDDLGGIEVTQDFLRQYSGTLEEQLEGDQKGERLVVDRDGAIEVLRARQVGIEGNPAIPYPTTCSYVLTGRIHYVVELRDESRQRTAPSGEIFLMPSTHAMTFSVLQVALTDELISGTLANPACQAFLETLNQDLPTYSYFMELFSGGMLRLHTSGGGDYIGDVRTQGTLDENYQLVQ